MKDTKIPIIFAANNYFIPYMATTIQSIMENADKNKHYIFYILHQEITYDYIELLQNQIAFFPQFSIEFINVAQYFSKYNLFISRHITVEAYFRLVIPELFGEYQKVIYLDGDMICCTDIASLFDIDLGNFLFAAVRDVDVAWYYSPNHTKYMKTFHSTGLLLLKNPNEYFNDGMCVFNIELFRKTISTDKLFELAMSREWQVHDQDVLNYVGEGKTLLLPYHWNLIFSPFKDYLPDHLRNEFYAAEKNPKIIHYKAWNYEVYISYFELFWKYATRTPFINVIIERMYSKELISTESFEERIISNIKRRKGIGIRFILINCLKAWFFRDKPNKKREDSNENKN
jgi:lipopolysaccharide biosynthesis glycosyltransferase